MALDGWGDVPLAEIEGFPYEIPAWIQQDICTYTIASIYEVGIANGAYMPAAEWYTAGKTISEHGDAVIEFIRSHDDDPPTVTFNEGWQAGCCVLMTEAVELWASMAYTWLKDNEPEEDEEDEEDDDYEEGEPVPF